MIDKMMDSLFLPEQFSSYINTLSCRTQALALIFLSCMQNFRTPDVDLSLDSIAHVLGARFDPFFIKEVDSCLKEMNGMLFEYAVLSLMTVHVRIRSNYFELLVREPFKTR